MSVRENAVLAVEREERERDSAARQAARRMWRALMLAPDLETLEALLAGQRVPIDRLDPKWVERFGLREQP